MKHFVYKTTNLVNGKYYIGKRSALTLSGTYLGSGTALKAALKKYGKENFKREILKEFNSSEEAYCYEAELVGSQEVLSRTCYNLTIGGRGLPLNHKASSKEFVFEGVTYPSLSEASRTIGVSRKSLRNWKEGQDRRLPIFYKGNHYSSVTELANFLGVCRETARKRLSVAPVLNLG